ncbi:malto-oligosyltrehalose trehalohydrolase [Sphingomonas sp.]|uniref:malto-oligosyltrehalose trehalohydrolase n=1 Tax=Sphingomonas sp. TaxID=28214 RepID=UPI003B00E1B3
MSAWGATLTAPGRARFRIWAPARKAITLEIDGAAPLAMTAAADGWFEAEAPAGVGTRYRYRLDAETAVADPASRAQDGDVHGWSLVVDPAAYAWQNQDWRGRPWAETVLWECHAGLLGGFSGVAERLVGLAALGITAIELMPVNAFSGTRNWGYDGVLPYAPAATYGTPDDLRALIDAAHGHGISVLLDVVYNHFGPDGNYLNAYAPGFFDEGKHTPWGGAVAVQKPQVADFFKDNARMWIEEYRIDGLRFDAVHAIRNDGFLDDLAASIRGQVPEGRHVHLVLENENNDAERLAEGKYDGQWNDDFHNVLHVLLTGERDAYYQDFADEPEAKLARCLSQGFIYQGDPSPNHDGEPRGKPSGHLPATRFVSFLQNHDQVGNRALGERLTLLTAKEKLRAATALLLLSPQIPLIFMGDAEGSEAPFLFFTDFHDELADAVRNGRRKEFAKFAAFASEADREKIPDPNAKGTFDASFPARGPQADEWQGFYRDWLTLRREHIVPRLEGTCGEGADVIGDKAVLARWRMGDGARLTIALNLGDAPVAVDNAGEPLASVGGGVADGRLAPASLSAWLEA